MNSKTIVPGNPLWNTRFKKYAFADGVAEDWQELFRNAEDLLLKSDIIKNSRSTTAGSFIADNKKFFIKRSNVNGFFERVRRIGRLPRAERNALIAGKLEQLNIRTPKVYMTLATGACWLPGASYLITEGMSEPMSAAQHLQAVCAAVGGMDFFIKKVAAMTVLLHRNLIAHGDLKMGNLLTCAGADGQMIIGLFDLDGSKIYRRKFPERVRCKELARLASSFCFYGLREKWLVPSELEKIKLLWCRAYAEAGGEDLSREKYFHRRFNEFLPPEKIEKII